MSAKNTPENFWAKVRVGKPDECWEWMGHKTTSGYGYVGWHGKTVVAHRLAYALAKTAIDLTVPNFRSVGGVTNYAKFALHKCDNRLCCNPEHLFLGTAGVNQLDCYTKNRRTQPKSGHVNAKLTPSQVVDIRYRYDNKLASQVSLAQEFGVSQRVISLIVRRVTYKDV